MMSRDRSRRDSLHNNFGHAECSIRICITRLNKSKRSAEMVLKAVLHPTYRCAQGREV